MEILTSLHGRRFGLGPNDELIINRRDGIQEIVGAVATVTVSSAQLLALNATPKTILVAPVAGLAIIPNRIAIHKPAGTAYSGIAAGEDLVLKYTGTAGAQCSTVISSTGFLDQATAQTRVANGPATTGSTAGGYAPVAAAPIVLHLLTGEITTGNSPLYVRIWYDVINTVFTA